MKPNGRRRWRRYCRGFYLNSKRAKVYRRHSGKTIMCVPPVRPPALAARPFTPLSLPGMSEAAKKRAAFRDVYVPFCENHPACGETPTRADCEFSTTAMQYDAGLAAGYKAARAKYRIGERLRPCPGEHGCVNCALTCGACEDQIPDDTKCNRCGSVMTTEGPFCDGSGLVPARKAKR